MLLDFFLQAEAEAVGWGAAGFNIIGAIILIGAVVHPYLEVKRTKKTFALERKFLTFYVVGAFLMLVNAIMMLCPNGNGNGNGSHQADHTAVFSTLLVVNVVSVTLNAYMWSVKTKNVKASNALGISEQEYWEKHIKPTLTNIQE